MNNISLEFSDWEYRNIALAVVTQCAELVHQLAVKGSAPAHKIRACLGPVYSLNADTIAELYPQPGDYEEGMQTLQNSFDSTGLREHAEVVRYLLGMLVIQQQLARAPAMQAEIGQRIDGFNRRHASDTVQSDDTAELQGQFPSEVHAEVHAEIHAEVQHKCSELARLYQDTISKLNFRIHVAGNPEYLRNQQVAEQIRALLLAGIRSAVLWHQLGGRRWHLFFYKRHIRDTLSGIRRRLISAHN